MSNMFIQTSVSLATTTITRRMACVPKVMALTMKRNPR